MKEPLCFALIWLTVGVPIGFPEWPVIESPTSSSPLLRNDVLITTPTFGTNSLSIVALEFTPVAKGYMTFFPSKRGDLMKICRDIMQIAFPSIDAPFAVAII
ncbi:MAG: hypothetical protein ACYDAV_12910 [Gammaproteobacteria bacterium]